MAAPETKKNTAPLVSVIMPAYNAGKTLEASAESVLAQTLAELELIIIDDGSTDDTAAVCAALAERDARVRTVTVKNSGPAAARNLGLDMASGKYVTLVDSDDLILPGMLETMLKGAEEHCADVCVCGASIEYPNGGGTERQIVFGESGLYSGERLKRLFDLPQMTIFFSGWGKLYKRSIIEENGIRMDTAYRITEDTDFAMRCLENCASVYLADERFYRYMQVNPSSLTQVRNAEGLKSGAVNIASRLKSLMLKWGVPEAEAKQRSDDYLFSQLNAAAFIKLRSGSERADKKAFYKEVMAVEGFKNYLKHGRFSRRMLAAGFAPAMAYTGLHGAYLKIKGNV